MFFLCGIHNAQLFSTGFGIGKLLIVFLILILGLGVTVYAAYRTYQYIVLDTIKTIYEGLSSLFQKILGMIIEKVDSISDGRLDLNGKQLNKAMDFGKMLNTNYKKFLRYYVEELSLFSIGFLY